MAEALRDPERVVVPFPAHPAECRPGEIVHLHDDADESCLRDLLEKSASEFFVDHVIWPLLGIAITALLILVITGSLWLSVKMALDVKALLA